MILHLIFILFSLIYFALIILLLAGIHRLATGNNEQQPVVSVIIAAHNESENIGQCLNALVQQTYPVELYEIIVIDDRSTDETAEIVAHFQNQHKNLHLLRVNQVPAKMAPKKYALSVGIERANGEIILTTDADTLPQTIWIESMVRYFEPDVGFVAGFSPLDLYEKRTILSRFMLIDSLSLAAVSAGSFGLNLPLTCNGRNLAYRRQAFEQVGGFDKIGHFISGDDDLLMHLIKNETEWKLTYAFDPQCVVHARPPQNFQQFANQRIRHASKGKHYARKIVLLLSAIYLYNFLLVLYFVGSIFASQLIWLWLASFSMKGMLDFVLMARFAARYRAINFLTSFPWASLLHPFYITIFGIWGQFGKFSWKDREYKSQT